MNEIYLYEREKTIEPQLNVWCAFPAVYCFGMSALGYLKVFQMFDEVDGVLAERIFTDTKTTYIQFKDIDLITFAFSFELDYVGILEILNKYHIPFLSSEREEVHPLIMGGGPVLSSNPEPFSAFFDFIVIGDAEPCVNQIIEIMKKDITRGEKLDLLSRIEGIYVPEVYSDISKHPHPNPPPSRGRGIESMISLPSIGEEEYLISSPSREEGWRVGQKKIKKLTCTLKDCTSTPILTENSFFPNTFIIEIERGCPQNCRFCLTSYINTPVRFCSYEQIIEKIELGLKYTNKLAFLGALICAHPQIDDICDYITNKVKSGMDIEVSVSSLRADYVSDNVLEMLHLCGQNTATIAVEAGSERLRDVINKRLKKEDIINLVDKMVNHGFTGLKMYGIIGLPTETYQDLDEFITLCREIKQKYKGFNLIPSFSTFVPKSHTPFQFAKREDTKRLEKKNEYMKKNLAKIGIKARLSSAKWDYIQALLSRGSSDLTPYLIEVFQKGANLGNFKSIYKEYEKKGLLPCADTFALDEQPLDKPFAWDFIEYPKSRNVLETEYKLAIGK